MYTQQSINQPLVKSRLTRRNWMSDDFRQIAIPARDASPSMSGQKAKDASQATFQLMRELAKPSNKGAFWSSVIDFAGSATVRHKLMSASDMAHNLLPISTSLFSGGTNITAALELAHKLCQETPAEGQSNIRWLRPVVILFSDGCHNRGPKPDTAAKLLRKVADVVTVAYGSDADIKLLRSLATSPQHHYICKDGSDLRQFFSAVGASMTASLASGVNATEALGQIQRLESGRSLQ